MTDQTIKNGKLVFLAYSICEQSGNVLEQSDLPVSYIHGGQSELIGGMDDLLVGKHAGDKVEFELEAEDGLGPYDPNLTFTDALDNVPPQFRHVGAEVEMENDAGEVRTFYVTEIADGRLTLDGNHPFAGKDLRVQIKITEVRDPTQQEREEYRQGVEEEYETSPPPPSQKH